MHLVQTVPMNSTDRWPLAFRVDGTPSIREVKLFVGPQETGTGTGMKAATKGRAPRDVIDVKRHEEVARWASALGMTEVDIRHAVEDCGSTAASDVRKTVQRRARRQVILSGIALPWAYKD